MRIRDVLSPVSVTSVHRMRGSGASSGLRVANHHQMPVRDWF
jgi:hypothetical protein